MLFLILKEKVTAFSSCKRHITVKTTIPVNHEEADLQSSTVETETGLRAQGKPGLHTETVPQKQLTN